MGNLSLKRHKSSSWKRFWQDQNEKLCSFDSFRDDLGSIFDEVLIFKNTKGSKTKLDFSVFDLPHIMLGEICTLTLEGQSYSLTLKEYAKLAVANSARQTHSHPPLATFNILMQLGGYLNFNETTMLNKNNAEDFFINVLTQKVTEKGCYNRLSPPAYRACFTDCNFVDIRSKMHSLGIDGLIEVGLTKKVLEKKIGIACEGALGLALPEYKKGGSFNTLTLEMGQYYVDHLRRVFHRDYFYTLICKSIIRNLQTPDWGARHREVILETMLGTFEQAKQGIILEGNQNYNNFYQCIKSSLCDQYEMQFNKVESLDEENIHRLVLELGLGMRFDAVEVIRVLMLQKYYDFGGAKKPKSVWEGYLRSLNKTELNTVQLKKLTVDDIYTKMDEVIGKGKLSSDLFIASLNKWIAKLLKNKTRSYAALVQEFDRVGDAMTSLVVSWLGYRKSEFGFPLKAISGHANLDILDNSHVPFRFKLKWYCPKTNGTSKIDREITSQCYQVAAQLNELFNSAEDQPCLYINRGRALNQPTSHESGIAISTRIRSNWGHFALNYKPFNDALELERLSNIPTQEMSLNEKNKFSVLQASYDLSSSRVQHLIDSGKEIKSNAPKIELARSTELKEKLVEFSKSGNIEDFDYKQLIDESMSEDTKTWLKSNKDDIENILDRAAITTIIGELLTDIRYPTPHSFRHIWAEAVLTRYQGDIGAVIRHQFCHLDESFFMAYLREKEAKSIVKVARIKVLNSLVDTIISDSDKVDSEYLGGFARYVKKAVSMTNAITNNSVRTLKESIERRVISLNPSYFATCVPREGGEIRAKCAEMGDIQPHNAKPVFCLSCTNAVITKGNLRGIWQTVLPFVKECLNEDVMGFMVQSHLPTLRSSYMRINELRSSENNESVDKILLVIKKAINSVEKKLKAEQTMYA
jgi:hypothetical protein